MKIVLLIMSSKPIIVAENISKTYNINVRSASLRQEGLAFLHRLMPFLPNSTVVTHVFHALQEISFTINKGERVAIMGRNGAGKTTLLRILSRITRPTTGQVSVTGTYAPLISLGTGFMSDLTGRENIYLSAAILGLDRQGIEDIIDEVIEFAELGEFIDSPVEMYSSGMRARLGFSVAIHSLPDIVFIDEVLSVGDISFTVKSRARIIELSRQGRTIVLVSHSLSAMREMCERGIWIERGRVVMDGQIEEVTAAYEAKYGNKLDTADAPASMGK